MPAIGKLSLLPSGNGGQMSMQWVGGGLVHQSLQLRVKVETFQSTCGNACGWQDKTCVISFARVSRAPLRWSTVKGRYIANFGL
jgi:hypothetical protein